MNIKICRIIEVPVYRGFCFERTGGILKAEFFIGVGNQRSVQKSQFSKNKIMESMKSGMCPCPHHKMLPLLLVAFGLVFFLGNLNILTQAAVTMTWPVIVMAAGLMKMMQSKCKCCSQNSGTCANCGKDGAMCK